MIDVLSLRCKSVMYALPSVNCCKDALSIGERRVSFDRTVQELQCHAPTQLSSPMLGQDGHVLVAGDGQAKVREDASLLSRHENAVGLYVSQDCGSSLALGLCVVSD